MFNNLNTKLKKVVVIFLIITLTYANLLLIGGNIVNGLISYAYEELEQINIVKANQELIMNKVYEIDGEEKRIIQVAVETGIEAKEYPIKESVLTLSTDIIEGTYEDITVTKLNKNSYTKGTYKVEEGKLKITLLNENETLESKEKGLDKLLVTYVFHNTEIETIKQPLEKVEVKTYKEEALANTVIPKDFTEINVEKDINELKVENKDMHKTAIEGGHLEFVENLKLDLSYRDGITKVSIEDVENNFYNIDTQLDEETTLKYKTTTINREDLINVLGTEGKLTISDIATNKALVELTKATIEAQEINAKVEQKFKVDEENEEVRSNVTVTNSEVLVEYVVDVTDFKLELLNIKTPSENNIELSDFVVKNTKSLSNVKNIENMNYLQEKVKYVINETEKTVESVITFKDTITRANLEIDNAEWVLGEANKIKYTITLDTTSEKAELFVNPMFLIKLPSAVGSVNTANSEFTVNNDNGAFTGKRVFVTTLLGRKYVAVALEGAQTNETIKDGDTTIELTLELNIDETVAEITEETKLYYQNDTVTAYESGKSFDSTSITVSMVMESEPKEDIKEEEKPDVFLSISSSTQEIIKQENEFIYDIHITNDTSTQKENLKLTSTLPEGISIVKVFDIADLIKGEKNEVEYTFDEETRTFTIDVDKLEGTVYEIKDNLENGTVSTSVTLGTKFYQIIVKADTLPEGTYSREVKTAMQLIEGEVVLAESEEAVNIISDVFLFVETDELPEKLDENEEIVFGLKITNKGLLDKTNIGIKIEMPEEISLRRYTRTVLLEDGQEVSKDSGTLSTDFELKNVEVQAKRTCYFQIYGTINEINETKQITIKGTANGEELSWTINAIETTPNPDDTENPGSPEEPSNPSNPENPSGPENPGESGTPEDPNDPENPGNPGDPENPSDPENPGNPNDPEKPGESEDDEEARTEGFDLSLKQYLNKVTVTNTKGTTTYDYEDTDFAKVEIHSKQMDGSKVTLEYKIVVKNEGTIPGYARKIVNYKSSDLKFNVELNPDWYLGEDENLYSVINIDKLLNPGDTIELKLILEKEMTKDNVGTITNLVEICEATNNENVEDVNSIPGDKLEGQNDMSKVEVMVVTSTGTIILYTTLSLIVIAILSFGFYRVKKVTINKKGGC